MWYNMFIEGGVVSMSQIIPIALLSLELFIIEV